jgi:hypothetical protein
MTKFFKNRQQAKLIMKEPRLLEDIKKEYNQLLGKAAEIQYVIYAQKLELEETNKQLLRVNREAAERMKLEDSNKEKEESK